MGAGLKLSLSRVTTQVTGPGGPIKAEYRHNDLSCYSYCNPIAEYAEFLCLFLSVGSREESKCEIVHAPYIPMAVVHRHFEGFKGVPETLETSKADQWVLSECPSRLSGDISCNPPRKF